MLLPLDRLAYQHHETRRGHGPHLPLQQLRHHIAPFLSRHATIQLLYVDNRPAARLFKLDVLVFVLGPEQAQGFRLAQQGASSLHLPELDELQDNQLVERLDLGHGQVEAGDLKQYLVPFALLDAA